MIIQLKPRDYQSSIVETAKDHNTLVVLPTGLGKTLIALLLSIHRFQQHPTEKILFLAPTRPLVEQHFNSFKEQLPELYADCQLFTGATPAPQRKKIWQTAEIIFSTPQCIANDLDKMRYKLEDVSLLIIDEAHRCLKNYAYTSVVKRYKDHSQNQKILGLTASPGSEAAKVNEICNHLDIQQIEVRDRESPDVAPFLQELEFEKVEVPFPKEFLEIKVLLDQLYMSKVNTLKERNLLFGPANKITLLKTQARLAAQASKRNWQAMVGMSLTAQAIKLSHAMELLETQTLAGLNAYLQDIKQQAAQKKSKGVQTLVNSAEFTAANLSLQQLLEKDIEHPKVEELATIIETQLQDNPQAKTIVFTQFRDSASVIASRLNTLPEVKAALFLGQAKRTKTLNKKEITTGLSQKEQQAVIQQFRNNEINVLVATSIGEEGLDIPEVSTVIFYEPIPSAIRKIQRAGRTARLNPGKLMILMTKDTRDIAFHYAANAREKKMYKTIESVRKSLMKRGTQRLTDVQGSESTKNLGMKRQLGKKTLKDFT